MSAWYRVGTVNFTFNSKAVTGEGCLWSANVSAGDSMTLDGSKFYEIDSLIGGDSLNLKTPYLEDTVTNSEYAIISVKGERGLEGEKGDVGPRGFNLYGAQGERGIQGLTGSQGLQGLQGIQGMQGAKGDKGDKGNIGYTGARGAQGIQGVAGIRGAQGEQGLQGSSGGRGEKGNAGSAGPAGANTEVVLNNVINQMIAIEAVLAKIASAEGGSYIPPTTPNIPATDTEHVSVPVSIDSDIPEAVTVPDVGGTGDSETPPLVTSSTGSTPITSESPPAVSVPVVNYGTSDGTSSGTPVTVFNPTPVGDIVI